MDSSRWLADTLRCYEACYHLDHRRYFARPFSYLNLWLELIFVDQYEWRRDVLYSELSSLVTWTKLRWVPDDSSKLFISTSRKEVRGSNVIPSSFVWYLRFALYQSTGTYLPQEMWDVILSYHPESRPRFQRKITPMAGHYVTPPFHNHTLVRAYPMTRPHLTIIKDA